MKTRRHILIASLTLLALFWTGCSTSSSVSAPPVDLPAPITGRVDISSPDADGNVHIMGAAGAVPGGSMVMAVNEAATTARIWKALDLLVAPAYAQTSGYPAVCSLAGHACVVAGADGSFEILIPAGIGDRISIGIIDPVSGDFLSELLEMFVPELGGGGALSAICAGLGLTGKAVDVKIIPGTSIPILLKQGSNTTTNQLVIGASNSTTVPIDGCHAFAVALKVTPSAMIVAVTSKEDSILWTGQFQLDGALISSHHFTLPQQPMHVIFADSDSQPIVALKTASSLQLAKISLVDGAVLETAAPLDTTSSALIDGIQRSVRLDMLTLDDNQHLGLLLSDTGDAQGAYITLFTADVLTHIKTWSPVQELQIGGVVDAAFAKSRSRGVLLALLEASQPNNLRGFSVTNSLGQAYLLSTVMVSADPATLPSKMLSAGTFAVSDGGLLQKVVTLDTTDAGSLALMSDADGSCYFALIDQSPHAIVGFNWVSGDVVSAIAADNETHAFFGADVTSGALLDGSGVLASAGILGF